VTATREIQLDFDVPCWACAYNLRGLSAAGKCPECGLEIDASLHAYETRRLALSPPEPRAARAAVEGAVLSLIAFALMWVPAAAPVSWYFMPYRYAPASESPGRLILLSVACAAWVLGWYAAWKMCRPPGGAIPPGASAVPRQVARWGLTLYATIPFLLPLMGDSPDSDAMVLLLLGALVSGGAGDAALFIHLAGVLRRCGCRHAAGQATLLAVANPAAMWFSMFIGVGRGGISSLDQMLSLPVCPYGVMYLFREFLYVEVMRGELPHPVLFVFLFAAVWPAALFVRLVFCLRGNRVQIGSPTLSGDQVRSIRPELVQGKDHVRGS